MWILEDFKLMFIHPPKTGGISISVLLTDSGFQYTQKHLTEELREKFFQFGNHHAPACLIPNINYDYTFSTFRDPVERIKSAYNYRFRDQGKCMTFEEFVEKGICNYDSQSTELIFSIIKPQVEYYTEKCEVFLFSELQKLPERLRSRGVYIKGDIQHLNKSNKSDFIISNCLLEKIKDFYKEDYLFYEKYFEL